MKAEHPFVDKVFNYDLTRLKKKKLNNIAVLGAHVRLYSQSSVKIPSTKHTPMLSLKYSRCLLPNTQFNTHV